MNSDDFPEYSGNNSWLFSRLPSDLTNNVIKQWPKISIVTPSYNQGRYIEETIRSVLLQNYPNLEYIIIDGGSSDETISIIKKYERWITYWVSEPDSGQSQAINKGLAKCTGTIFNWLNSDDYLEEGALFTIAAEFKDPAINIVAGAVQNFDKKGPTKLYFNQNLSLKNIFGRDTHFIYHQPGVWMRLNEVKATSPFREDYHFCFDYDFMLRHLVKHSSVKYIDKTIARFRIHNDSKTVSQSEKFNLDLKKIYHDFYISQKGSPYFNLAKRKSHLFDWSILYKDIRKKNKSRLASFAALLIAMAKDPKYRISKDSFGNLKHVLFGKD